MLLLIVWGGRSIIAKFRVFADESGWFRRTLGIIFLLIGLGILSGIDKIVEARVLEYFDVSRIESGLLDRLIPVSTPIISPMVSLPPIPMKPGVIPVASMAVSTGEIPKSIEKSPESKVVSQVQTTRPGAPAIIQTGEPRNIAPSASDPVSISLPAPEPVVSQKLSLVLPDLSVATPYAAPEIPASLTEWIHSSPLTMKSLRGKVVLIDFWTLGCINCQRTLPYVTSWDRKYRDQ